MDINRKAVCGTRGGYNRHLRLKETTCEPCREASRLWVAQYAAEHPERIKATNKIAREKYRAKIETKLKRRIYAQKFLATDEGRERLLRATHRRLARKSGNGTEPYTTQLILDLYGSDCYLCGSAIDLSAPRATRYKGWEVGLHLDHVIPLSKGGNDFISNIRPTHGLCNAKKNRFIRGFSVASVL